MNETTTETHVCTDVHALRSGDPDFIDDNADDEHACDASCPKGYECTRTKGHEGDHAAHGGHDQQYCRWPQT